MPIHPKYLREEIGRAFVRPLTSKGGLQPSHRRVGLSPPYVNRFSISLLETTLVFEELN
jgi:hypothetical protein